MKWRVKLCISMLHTQYAHRNLTKENAMRQKNNITKEVKMTLKNKFTYFIFMLLFIASSANLAIANLFSPCEKMRPPMRGIESIQDLSSRDLSCMDLSHVRFYQNVDLSRANFTGSNLEEADLRSAILVDANFTGAYLYKADFRKKTKKTNLTGAILRRANLAEAKLIEAILIDADLTKASLVGAILIDADLAGADLAGADLAGADLAGATGIGEKLY